MDSRAGWGFNLQKVCLLLGLQFSSRALILFEEAFKSTCVLYIHILCLSAELPPSFDYACTLCILGFQRFFFRHQPLICLLTASSVMGL